MATHWLGTHLGPFTQIVDGRKFANQFKRLQREQHKSKAKVGMNKAPDFVMQDATGKWHILECKGTQSSREYQKSVLKTARAQKHAIQLVGSARSSRPNFSVLWRDVLFRRGVDQMTLPSRAGWLLQDPCPDIQLARVPLAAVAGQAPAGISEALLRLLARFSDGHKGNEGAWNRQACHSQVW